MTKDPISLQFTLTGTLRSNTIKIKPRMWLTLRRVGAIMENQPSTILHLDIHIIPQPVRRSRTRSLNNISNTRVGTRQSPSRTINKRLRDRKVSAMPSPTLCQLRVHTTHFRHLSQTKQLYMNKFQQRTAASSPVTKCLTNTSRLLHPPRRTRSLLRIVSRTNRGVAIQ